MPHIINVYIEPGFVNVAMEPPHDCFWIEASPDMPNVLKHRCVEAFEKLHARGILHGDAELRHILINADARVTIIDFKAAATCVPLENVGMEEVGLRRATPEEFRLEMRRVKFKLDYDGAREKERGKLMRKKQGKPRKEDVFDPPVDLHVLNFQWLEGCERRPTRFVVPGQTKEQVDLAVKRFLNEVGEMGRQMGKKIPVAQGRGPVSAVKEKGPDLPEVPVAPPRSGLKIKIPPLNTLSSPIRATPGPTSLLPPFEIPRAAEAASRTPGSFAEPPPLAAEEASLQSKPSIEGRTDDKAVTHSAEGELAFSCPGLGCFSPSTTIITPLATTVTESGNYSGDEPLLGVPRFDFPLAKWADGESDHFSGSEGHKDSVASQVTSTAPPPTQRSAGSAFPIMRTFADVARRAIQVFGRLAGQNQVQPKIDPPQQQKVLGSDQRKRRLSDSSSSESNEYEAGRQRKRLRRSTISNPSDPPRPTLVQIPHTWSLLTAGQSRGMAKRKRESEETSKLVWTTEQELRRKRCKLSELSDLSDASGSEVEDDTTTGRAARLGKTSTGSVADKTALLDTLSTTRRESALQSDKKPTPIIVRDYAYIPHKVPKAPYVPHPPTENRMAAERAKHISLSNAKACLDAGLPYPMTENQQGKIVPDLAPSPYMFSAETFEEKQKRKKRGREMGVKGMGRVQRSFGNLKRKVDARRTGTNIELEERLLASWKDVGHRLKEKVTSKVRFNLENLRGDVQCPSGDANPGVLHRVVRSVKETSGILKRPPPIKIFDYQAPWEEDDNALSPKVGPEPERWDRSGGFGMFGVWVKDSRSKTEETFREECALRVYESQRVIESVDAEWRQEEDKMEEVRRKEAECSLVRF